MFDILVSALGRIWYINYAYVHTVEIELLKYRYMHEKQIAVYVLINTFQLFLIMDVFVKYYIAFYAIRNGVAASRNKDFIGY